MCAKPSPPGLGWRTPGGTAESQDEINAIVKRKVGQIRELGVEIVLGTDVGSWREVTGHATWMEADLGSASLAWPR